MLNEHGFEPLPAHHIDSTGSINKQIIEKIVNCELVIANLTSVNPNVLYELAIRHSFGKRVITVAEHGTKLPFDIIDQRTFFYSDTMHGVDKFKPELSKAIKKCIEENEDIQNISNPIYDAVKQIAEIKSLPEKDRNVLEIILNKLNNIIPSLANKDNYDNSKETYFDYVIKIFGVDSKKIIIELQLLLIVYESLHKANIIDLDKYVKLEIFNASNSFIKKIENEILKIDSVEKTESLIIL